MHRTGTIAIDGEASLTTARAVTRPARPDRPTEARDVLPSSEQRLRAYASVLVRHRLAVIGTTIAVLLVGLVPALLADETYASTASVRVRPETAGSPFSDTDEPNAQNRSRELVTDVEVIQSDRLRDLVGERVDGDFGTAEATLVGFSEVIEITVSAGDPDLAAAAANAYAEVYVSERQRRAVETLVDQSEELRRRADDAATEMAAIDAQLGAPGTDPVTAENLRVRRASLADQVLDFSARADELEVEAALREGGTEIVNPAKPEPDPVSPDPLRSALMAGVLGLLAGIGVAVVLDVVQDRISSPDDLVVLDPSLPVLTAVPHLARPPQRPVDLDPRGREAFRYLRASLHFRSLDRPIQSLLVASAVAEEGKTTTAVNLAVACAEAGARVVLVDADLRRPSVHQCFDLELEPGLTDVLAGRVTFADAITYVEPNLAVLPAGASAAGSHELLERPAFAQLLQAAAKKSDLVVVDAPPVLQAADALVAARAIDAALVVARVGQVRRREVRALLRRLRDARIPLIGFVANGGTAEVSYGEYAPLAGDRA